MTNPSSYLRRRPKVLFLRLKGANLLLMVPGFQLILMEIIMNGVTCTLESQGFNAFCKASEEIVRHMQSVYTKRKLMVTLHMVKDLMFQPPGKVRYRLTEYIPCEERVLSVLRYGPRLSSVRPQRQNLRPRSRFREVEAPAIPSLELLNWV